MAPTRRTKSEGPETGIHVPVNMPVPPPETSDFPAGRHTAEAQQQAELDIRSGAVDATNVDAGRGPLAEDGVIDARRDTRLTGARKRAQNSSAAGIVLKEEAEQGHHTARPHGVGPLSLQGATHVLSTARAHLAETTRRHAESLAVLDGRRPTADGQSRAGAVLAPGTRHLLPMIVLVLAAEYALLGVPLLVEGAIVAENMRMYFRSDDATPWVPWTIAVVAVLSLTVVPFVIGRVLNDVLHGRQLSWRGWAVVALGAASWLFTGLLLAFVRVSVDQEHAVDRAEDRYTALVEEAELNGLDPADIPRVVPAEVFDPTLPTFMWIGILLGTGIALVLFEAAFRNPERLEELRARRAVALGEREEAALVEYLSRVASDVRAQEAANAASAAQWEIEYEHIAAEAALCKRVYDVALANAAGAPEMAIALETRRREDEEGR